MKGLNKLNNDKTAPEWERIKKWLGGAEKNTKHPVQEHFERQAQKMSGGGIAGMDDDPNRLLQEIAPPGVGTLTPSPARTPLQMPEPLQPVAPPAPVVQPPVQAPEPQIPQQPMPTVPPPGTTSGQQADQILGTNQQELRDYLTRLNTPSIGERAGNAITGLGDAIIQGVANRGPGHFQENFQKRNQDQRAALGAIPGQVAGLGKEKFDLTQKMDAENPDSPYSKISQKTYGPDLVKMGLTPEEVQRMPASLIGDVFAKKVSLEEVKARIAEEGAFKRASLGLQEQTLKNTMQNQQSQQETEAAKSIAGRGVMQRMADAVFGNPGVKVLENRLPQSGGNAAPVPEGRVTVVRPDGTVGHIPSSQLKAALKKGYKQQ